jgi:hypothetical protein
MNEEQTRRETRGTGPGTVDANLGTSLVICPVGKCTTTQRFTETAATLAMPVRTNKSREEYLRLAHKAGRH